MTRTVKIIVRVTFSSAVEGQAGSAPLPRTVYAEGTGISSTLSDNSIALADGDPVSQPAPTSNAIPKSVTNPGVEITGNRTDGSDVLVGQKMALNVVKGSKLKVTRSFTLDMGWIKLGPHAANCENGSRRAN